MKHIGKLITLENEPIIQKGNMLLRICKGSRIALEATGKKMEGLVEYEVLPSSQVAILNFHLMQNLFY
jgi:hypothetical protein